MSGKKDFSALTEKQSEVLAYLEQEIAHSGRSPSLREIARYFKWKAVGTVEDHVRALVQKGFVIKEPSQFHGLKLAHQSPSSTLPILGAVPAGSPLEAIPDSLGSLSFSMRWQPGLYALKVKGESMRDAGILDGDYVVVKQQPDAQDGEIVVALIEGEATVKRLEKNKGKIRLLPENPDFKPIEIPRDRESCIQGKVIAVQRFY